MLRRTAIAAVLAAATASFAWVVDGGAEDAGPRCDPPPANARPFPETKLYFEHNATDGDTGLHGMLDASGWSELCVYDPAGRQILAVRPHESLAGLGMATLFFESREPKHSEVSVEDHLRNFPAGSYEIRGLTHDGSPLKGAATLSHAIPAAATITAPADGAVVPSSGLVVRWEPVTRSISGATLEPSAYQVIVTNSDADDPHGFAVPIFDVHVPPSLTSLTVPDEFLEPGTSYEIEVLALEPSGNQTISAVVFETAGALADLGGANVAAAPPAAASCQDDPVPPGSEICPEECTGDCGAENLCTIDCRGRKTCEEMKTIACPEGYACRVLCEGLDACDANLVRCPKDHACTLVCDEKDGCGDVVLECGSASCSIECGAHPASCEGTIVACGAGACNARCEGSSAPYLNECERSCGCSGC